MPLNNPPERRDFKLMAMQASAPANPPAGMVKVYVDNAGVMSWVDENGIVTTAMGGVSGQWDLASTDVIRWSQSADPTDVKDVGFARKSPGFVQITDGSTGYGGIVSSNFSLFDSAFGGRTIQFVMDTGSANQAYTVPTGYPLANTGYFLTADTTGVTSWALVSTDWANPGTIGSSTPNTGAFTTLSVSANGAASTPAETIIGTWFTGGTATTTKPQLLIEPTGTTSTGWSTSGTGIGVNAASGFAGRLLDLQVNGSTKFRVNSAGDVTIASGGISAGANINTSNTGAFFWSGRSRMLSPADGVVTYKNSAGTDFTAAHYGGDTSSFPAIKRNGAALNFRLADDSADAAITAAAGTFSGQVVSTLATGTAPFVVASTTNVANLNASSLNGATFSNPGDIGLVGSYQGKFTALYQLAAGVGATTGILTATTESAALSGASYTFTNLIPAGALVLGVTTRVTTTITSGDGATSFQIGDGTDVDRWGTGIAFTSGTTTSGTAFTITTTALYTAATSVVITATGGTFSGGKVRAVVHYILFHPADI